MKYSREIDCQCNIRASLSEDGTFIVRARGRAGPEAVGGEIQVPELLGLAIRNEMQIALDDVHETLAAEIDQRVSYIAVAGG